MVHLPALSYPVSRGIVHINENAELFSTVYLERINFKTRQRLSSINHPFDRRFIQYYIRRALLVER